MDGEWEVAKKGKRKNRGNTGGPLRPSKSAAPITSSIEPTEKSIARHKEAVEDARRELVDSNFYSSFLATISTATLPSTPKGEDSKPLLSSIKNLVIYGLGSIDQLGGVHIRFQLALAHQLSTLLSNLTTSPEAFDPVFSPHDHAILPLLGIEIIKENEHGKRIAQQRTLFFMPHCEVDLTENLLATNIASKTLQNVVIIGNSFAQYQERWSMLSTSQQKERKRPEKLLNLVEAGQVVELPLPESGFPVTAAFNDMSVHMFK